MFVKSKEIPFGDDVESCRLLANEHRSYSHLISFKSVLVNGGVVPSPFAHHQLREELLTIGITTEWIYDIRHIPNDGSMHSENSFGQINRRFTHDFNNIYLPRLKKFFNSPLGKASSPKHGFLKIDGVLDLNLGYREVEKSCDQFMQIINATSYQSRMAHMDNVDFFEFGIDPPNRQDLCIPITRQTIRAYVYKQNQYKNRVRDPRVRRAVVVDMYNSRCQLCDEHTIIEGAHAHKFADGGLDVIGNMYSLCRNHHRQYDLGMFTIGHDMMTYSTEPILNGRMLNMHPAHMILPESIIWHNEFYAKIRKYRIDHTIAT